MFLGNGIVFNGQIFDDVNHVHHIVEHDRTGDDIRRAKRGSAVRSIDVMRHSQIGCPKKGGPTLDEKSWKISAQMIEI